LQSRTWAAAMLGILLIPAGCGTPSGSPSSSTTPAIPASAKLKLRAFVSNQAASFGSPSGQVDVIDAQKDVIVAIITIGGVPGIMALTPDKTKLLVIENNSNTLDIIDVATQAFTAQIPLGDTVTSLVVMPDNKTGFVVLRNSSRVLKFDLTTNTSLPIVVGTPRTLVLSHDGKKLLVFSDDFDYVNVIDTSTLNATPIFSARFDRPSFAVFSTDDTKAFVLNCGPECGGRAASVTVLDMATNTPGTPVPVSAATVALLDGTNLYVAGTQGAAGKLDVISTSGLTVSKSGVAINDGFHSSMALGSNNRLFVGARTCSNVATGCLSIFNTSSQTAVIGAPKGAVTGIQPISGRDIVYVCEGGELRIYDTTKDAEQTTPIVDIVGKAIDVKTVEQ
jgi:YVTN family beta-propeller protein